VRRFPLGSFERHFSLARANSADNVRHSSIRLAAVSDAQYKDRRTLVINAINHSVLTHTIPITTCQFPFELLDASAVAWIRFETIETSIQSALQVGVCALEEPLCARA
jgi:hypothetical protein